MCVSLPVKSVETPYHFFVGDFFLMIYMTINIAVVADGIKTMDELW